MTTQSIFGPLRTAWHDLKYDLKSTRWLRVFGWTLGVCWLFGLIASAITVGIMSMFIDAGSACLPDGTFSLRPETFSMWSSTSFFQITLGGGNLNFTKAKMVDIVWDIGIGRGGQAILAFISRREFARYLTICMATEPVTYQVFRTIFIMNDASVLSTCRTIKSFITQRRLRSKIAMAFMTATMIFILAFPTLMSAMSGYDSNVSSRVPDRSDNLVPFYDFSRVLYVIHDAKRIGVEEDDLWLLDYTHEWDPVIDGSVAEYDLVYATSQYVKKFGLGGGNTSSTFQNSSSVTLELEAPTLSITAYTLEDAGLGGYNISGAQGMTWIINDDAQDMTWIKNDNGKLFDRTYIEQRGQCQNTGTYKWGFSFLQLFLCIILLLAWTIGIYIMWLYTHYTLLLHSRLSEEVSGAHRAVLELAAAMQSELDLADLDVSLLREKQLDERVEKEIKGGTVSYAYAEEKIGMYSIRRGLRDCWRKNKWWLMAMFCMTMLCSTLWKATLSTVFSWLWLWLWFIWLGLFYAFFIGTTTGSRLLVVLFWVVVGTFAVAIPAIVIHTRGSDS